MPIRVELVRFRIDWARLMDDEDGLPLPPLPGGKTPSEPGVAMRALLLLSRREFRVSRFSEGGRWLRWLLPLPLPLPRRAPGGDADADRLDPGDFEACWLSLLSSFGPGGGRAFGDLEDCRPSLGLFSSSGGVGSRMLRLKGRRGMGRSKGGPPSSGVSDMAAAMNGEGEGREGKGGIRGALRETWEEAWELSCYVIHDSGSGRRDGKLRGEYKVFVCRGCSSLRTPGKSWN